MYFLDCVDGPVVNFLQQTGMEWGRLLLKGRREGGVIVH